MKTKSKKGRREFRGEPIVGGIAVGPARFFGSRQMEFPRYWINEGELKGETRRFERALKECKNQFAEIQSKLCRIQGREQMTILDSHIMLLQDDLLVQNTIHSIEKDAINAEWALMKTIGEIREAFTKINQSYFRERRYDIDYIGNAICRQLMGQAQDFFSHVPRGSIVVAPDLSPAETLHLIRYHVGGFVIEMGGVSSHTAIVARSLEIPTVLGVEGLSRFVSDRDRVIVDGARGRVIVNPRSGELQRYSKIRMKDEAARKVMKQEARLKAVTPDHHSMKILANMELSDEIHAIRESGADGVGLYRTEFFFLDRDQLPSAREQEKIYRNVLRRLAPQEVTIRTLDLGADKLKPESQYADQANPALGLRAIRFCLREKTLFQEQLKALLAASTAGNLKISFPMISSVDEFRAVKKMVLDLTAELRKKGVRVAKEIPLGVMIETPAAVLEMDLLAAEADFFSVGTNDLIQYLLACDRTNELVSYLYNPLHPSVIRTLKRIIETAGAYAKEVTLCGEMAADPQYLLLIMALGFNRLSMNSASIPKIKKMIREASMTEAQELLEKVLLSQSVKETRRLLQVRMKELYPHYFQ